MHCVLQQGNQIANLIWMREHHSNHRRCYTNLPNNQKHERANFELPFPKHDDILILSSERRRSPEDGVRNHHSTGADFTFLLLRKLCRTMTKHKLSFASQLNG